MMLSEAQLQQIEATRKTARNILENPFTCGEAYNALVDWHVPQLIAALREAIEALEFYGDPANWELVEGADGLSLMPMQRDWGQRARKLLGLEAQS